MSDLKNLTLVVPTYMRPLYARRVVDFWKDTGVHLHVLDGSPEASMSGSVFGEYNRVHYHHMPNTPSSSERWLYASEVVDTPYAALMADDDFFVPSGLRECIDQMDSDNSLVGCFGKTLYFFYQGGQILAHETYLDRQYTRSDGNSALERVRLLNNYGDNKISAMIYGIFRAEAWKQVMRSSFGQQFHPPAVPESIFRILMPYFGEVRILDVLYWLRSGEVGSSPHIVNDGVFLHKWAEDPAYAHEVSEYKRVMIDAIVQAGESNLDAVADVISDVTQAFFDRRKMKDGRGLPLDPLRRQRDKAITLSPRWIKTLSKKLLPRIVLKLLGWSNRSWDDALRSLSKKGVSIDFTECGKIEKFLIEFHRKTSGVVA